MPASRDQRAILARLDAIIEHLGIDIPEVPGPPRPNPPDERPEDSEDASDE